MTEPRHRKRGLGFGKIAAGLLLAALAMVVVWRGVVDHLARFSPVQALAWAPGHPEALTTRIEQSMAAESVAQELLGLARALLQSSPLDGRGFRGLAVGQERNGQNAAAATAYRLAAARAPRDIPSQIWLANAAITAGRLPEALGRIDRILRVEPELLPQMKPVLDAAAGSETAWPALATVLSAKPPWRSAYLAQLSGSAGDSAALAPLYLRLQSAGAGLQEQELRNWLDRLIRDRHWAAAYQLWARTLPEDRRDRLDNVYNGSFDQPASGLGFDWRFDRVPGALVERAESLGDKEATALRVSFLDRRVPFEHVRQLLLLSAGDYVLSGEAMTEGLRSERGLVWTLRCADNGKVLGETAPVLGRQPWRPFQLEFDVPAEACGAQWLSLRLPARIAAEQRIGGSAWFDRMAVTPCGTNNPAAGPHQR